MNSSATELYLFGAGGHAKVCYDLILALENYSVVGIFSPDLEVGERWLSDITCVGNDSMAADILTTNAHQGLVNGLGFVPRHHLRKKIVERFNAFADRFVTLIHPKSTIAHQVSVSIGCQIMASATIQYGVHIAEHTIINTGAIIEHDCKVGRLCHVAPGSVLCGDVNLEDEVFVGAGAVILPGLTVGKGAVIGAGAVVKSDVAPGAVVS